MMKLNHVVGTVAFGLMLVLVNACESSQKKQKSWSGQMQNMSQDVKQLIPYVFNKTAYSDPKNEPVISRALADLSQQSHMVSEEMGKQFLGDDPIISYSLKNLQADLGRAHDSFNKGQKDYSRSVMKSSMGHCFRCHSLTTIGSEAQWDLSDFSKLELTAEEKLDLLVAARKYQEAFEFAENEIGRDGLLKDQPLMFENFLRKHLSLSIRLNKDRNQTISDLDRVLKNQELPVYLEKQVKAWKGSLSKWNNFNGKQKSHSQVMKLAQKKITEGKRLQEFAYDHAGDVEYIWATEILHESLKSQRSQKEEAEIYFLLGLSYEVLDDMNSYGLHESYFEACIEKDPKSKIAKRCYKSLEGSVVQGFSGSAGTSLPADERQRLERFKKLTQ